MSYSNVAKQRRKATSSPWQRIILGNIHCNITLTTGPHFMNIYHYNGHLEKIARGCLVESVQAGCRSSCIYSQKHFQQPWLAHSPQWWTYFTYITIRHIKNSEDWLAFYRILLRLLNDKHTYTCPQDNAMGRQFNEPVMQHLRACIFCYLLFAKNHSPYKIYSFLSIESSAANCLLHVYMNGRIQCICIYTVFYHSRNINIVPNSLESWEASKRL